MDMSTKATFKVVLLGIVITLAMPVLAPNRYAALGEEAKPAEHEGGGEGSEGESKPEIAKSKKDLIEGDPGNEAIKGPFIELKQMNVVSIYRGTPVHHTNLVVVLEMPDMEQYDFVLKKIEILRSAMVEDLHAVASAQKGALMKDFDFLKQRMLQVANKTIGEGHVKSVLIKASAGRNLPGYFTAPKNPQIKQQP